MLCGAANIVMKDLRKLAAEKHIGSRSITASAADTKKPTTKERPVEIHLFQCEAAGFDKAKLDEAVTAAITAAGALAAERGRLREWIPTSRKADRS